MYINANTTLKRVYVQQQTEVKNAPNEKQENILKLKADFQ